MLARTRLSGIALAALVLAVPAASLRAQDDAIEEELANDVAGIVEKAADQLAEKIAEQIRDAETRQEFAKQVARAAAERYGQHIAGLQKELAAKEARIAELEKRVAELVAKAEAATDEAEKQPSNAFLGVDHVEHDRGALVVKVHEGSPAAAAGVQEDDVIVAVAGDEVTSPSLTSVLRGHPVGTEVTLRVLRDGEALEVPVKLADREAYFAAREEAEPEDDEAQPLELGVVVVEAEGGLRVETVEEGFTGQAIGLQEGDLIVKVAGQDVRTTGEVVAAVRQVKAGQRFTVTTRRGEETAVIEGIAGSGKGAGELVERKVASAETPETEEEPAASETPEEEEPAAGEAEAKPPAYLGVSVAETGDGIVVESVTPDSGAAAWGLQAQDVILELDGTRIRNLDHLLDMVGRLHAGDRIDMVLRREGEEVTVEGMRLGARGEKVTREEPAAEAGEDAEKPEERPGEPAYLGISAYEDSAEEAVLVKDVFAEGPAAKAGLRPGDALVRLGDTEVSDFASLGEALAGLRAGDEVKLAVRRDDEEVELGITLGKRPSEE